MQQKEQLISDAFFVFIFFPSPRNRMGSFTSAPQIKNVDYQDDKLEITDGMSVPDLVDYCRIARGDERPQLVKRKFLKPIDRLNGSDLTDGFKMLQLDSISKSKLPMDRGTALCTGKI